MGELRELAEFTCHLQLEKISNEVVKAARYCVLDNMGAALGAIRYEEIPALFQEFSHWAGAGSAFNATIWGQKKQQNIFLALLINGMMGHALELDDVHAGSKSHIGAVVVVTAWTLAEALQSTGREFLQAVIVGYEVMARIGMAMDVASNRKRGWHTTGIIGTFGAAAVAAHLLKLDGEKTVSAFGMAGTQSCGLWAFLEEGSTCKKLHPARAALNGLTAALLAQGGMTGPEHILDAKDGGLYAAVSDSYDVSLLTRNLGKRYEITKIDKKPYPCCRTTHHAIDAALLIRSQAGFDPQQIADVLVETYDVGVLQCGSSKYPESSVEAKFSIPYTCAAAFVCGKVTQGQFDEETLQNRLIMQIAKQTRVKSDPLFTRRYPERWGNRLTVTLKNGEVLVRQIDDMSGSVRIPLTEKQERNKFLGLAETVYDHDAAEKLMNNILKIDNLPRLPELL
jgi:2-methylcitrate dehydratase PrpD